MSLQYAIALTGGIGSGKSTVSSMLALYGYTTIDADKIAHTLLEANQAALIEHFSTAILDTDGKIDRKKLGKLIFTDTNARKKLEGLLHPQIHQKILSCAKELEGHQKYYFLDIPLFFETGGRERYGVKKVVLVYAPYEIQCMRIMARDTLSKEEASQRLAAQMDIEHKKLQSDYILINSQDLKALQKEVEKFLHTLS
ncbi:dephospho-CoA kinase [Helicobacter sp. 12S02634-8]|uniref:dephospho-CoA kinase n=1 Tax=Helicobacter sp. 12S02634-8 TaxID=1476199 RepID=UPI000BA5E0C6|nr:dephospho-CoA kinase [Helicobacter sp. 12S02634-8]PAF48409.1 dephospho-CoA kinase [Helicobacter sp. 12S02634-8]